MLPSLGALSSHHHHLIPVGAPTDVMEQFCDEEMYRLDIKRGRVVSSRHVLAQCFANQQDIFQVLPSPLCDYFVLGNNMEVCFVNLLARCLFALQTLTDHPPIMYVDQLRELRVPDYTNGVFPRGHRCKHIFTSRMGFHTGIKYLQVSIVKYVDAVGRQLRLSKIFDCIAIYSPFNPLGFRSLAARFCFPAAFAISSVRTLRHFSGAVHDRADGPGCLTRLHCFSRAILLGMALRITEGLAAEFAAIEPVLWLVEIHMAVLFSLQQSLVHSWRCILVVGEALEQ